MRLSEVEKFSINNLWNGIYRPLKQCECFQDAAQCLADACFEEFKESLVLMRLFITIPQGDLPKFNQDFVRNMAASMGHENELNDETPVLSLVGSRGVEPAWNDWQQSQAHIGIPLLSRQVVQEIPMIAQLLKDLGLGIDWLSTSDADGIGEVRGHTGGVFLVPDATTSIDSQGRKIIPGQEFVKAYGVKTVFGNGARLSAKSNEFLVAIFFTRQSLDKGTTHRFNSLLYLFKTTTMPLIESNRIYA